MDLKGFAGTLRDRLRGIEWLVLGLVLLLIVLIAQPSLLFYLVATLSKVFLLAFAGYWIDRRFCRPEDRPHVLEGQARSLAYIRRAIIVGACILAGGVSV